MRSALAALSFPINSPQALMILSSSSAAVQAEVSTCTSLAGSAPVAKALFESIAHSREAAAILRRSGQQGINGSEKFSDTGTIVASDTRFAQRQICRDCPRRFW